ncbi:MAG: CapA family protein [bacterium]
MPKKYILPMIFLFGLCLVAAVFIFYFSPAIEKGERSVTLLLGGDIYPGNRIKKRLKSKGAHSFTAKINKIKSNIDLHFANLEPPITSRDTTAVEKTYLFRSSPEVALPLLESLAVDGVSLANNHILDYGLSALEETRRHLESIDIGYSGAGKNREIAEKPHYFEVKGYKVALISFSNTYPRSFWADKNKPGTAFGEFDRVKEAVERTSDRADMTVISFHWGSELDTAPQKYQRRLARASIDAGADVVFGHHPHVIQPVEKYKDGIIYYSLGNYLFTTLSDNIQYGLLAEVKLTPGEKPETRFHLLNVNNYQVNYTPAVARVFNTSTVLARYLNKNYNLRLAVDG